MPQSPAGLRRDVRVVDVVTLGAGAAIGVSIFSVLSPAARIAGPGLLLALALAAVPMVIFAVVYAFMGSAVPTSGASYEWPSRFVHPFVGFLIAWLRILASAGAIVVLALVLVQYLSSVVDLPVKPAMFAICVLVFLLNLFGVQIAAGVQTGMLVLMLLTFSVFVIAGVPSVDTAHFQPVLESGWAGIVGAVPLLISLYLGIESGTEIGEEIQNSQRVITRGLTIAVVLTALTYAAVAGVTLGTLGASRLAASRAPLMDAAQSFLGSWAGPVILIAAATAIGTTLNGVFLIFTRYLFAMGRSGVLPAALGRIHPAWGTPHVATGVAFACCVLGLFLPQNLVFLFLAVNIPTMLKYSGACLAAIRLVDIAPDLHEQAHFRLSRRSVRLWSYLGVLCGISIVLVGLTADWRPYAVLVVWGVAGTIYWRWRSQSGVLVPNADGKVPVR